MNQLRANIIAVILDESPQRVYDAAAAALSTLGADGTWSDIDYDKPAGAGWPAAAHLDRMLVLAKAYALPGQNFFQNPEVLDAAQNALLGFEARVVRDASGQRSTRNGNWWFWNLSTPMKLGQTLLLLEEEIDSDLIQQVLASYKWCLQNPFDTYMTMLYGRGTNSMWALKGNLYYAVLTKNADDVETISKTFSLNFDPVVAPDEGLSPDAGFMAHGMLDFGGYYRSFADDAVVMIARVFAGTDFQIEQSKLDAFSANLYDGVLWTLYGGHIDYGLRGRHNATDRHYTREGSGFVEHAVRQMTELPGGLQPQLKDALLRMETGMAPRTGHKHFYNGDFTVNRSAAHYVSLRMHSDRNIASEAFGGAGMNTTFLGDGSMWIMNDPAEFWDGDTFPILNWNELAGTTVLEGVEPLRYRSYVFGSEPFAGGVSDGQDGVSAMELGKVSIPLNARKSWFFFGAAVVCLGSDLHSGGSAQILSVVDQRRVLPDSKLYVDGVEQALPAASETLVASFLNFNRTGYVFPTSTPVTIRCQTRVGKWSDVCERLSATEHSGEVLSLSLRHAEAGSGRYAYIILPDASEESTRAFATAGTIQILENSVQIHAVHEAATGLTGIVFWPPERERLSVDLSERRIRANGIVLRAQDNTGNAVLPVVVAGESGRASRNPKVGLRFAVNEERLGYGRDVILRMRWFDDADAPEGAFWRVEYDAMTGHAITGYMKYGYTGNWVDTEVELKNVRFTEPQRNEPGVDLVIRNTSAPIDLQNPKYAFGPLLPHQQEAAVLYGPVVSRIELSPADAVALAPYHAGFGLIETDAPCIAMYREDGSAFSLSVASPDPDAGPFTLSIARALQPLSVPEGVTVELRQGKTVLTLPAGGGQTLGMLFLQPVLAAEQ